ncbi:MAG: AAA family ATPase [Candidatus Thermoplasmatota archaeon]
MGRDSELTVLKTSLSNALRSRGSTIFISGEAGIGKTRLVEEFRKHAGARDVKILSGTAAAETVHPFLVFSKALEHEISRPLFHEQEYTSFAEVFAVNGAGLLLAQASPGTEDGLDADIFAGMLTAVQSFVRDSFDSTGKQSSGLGRLEYDDMKILIEHGTHLFLSAVVRGSEHQDMKALLRRTVHALEEKYGTVLGSWSGSMDEVMPIQEEISSLAGARFLVRRDLEGVKLENERLRIADRVLEVLVEMARTRPLLLILEDLHWAEESSLFVLNYLARNLRKEKMLIVGTLRPEEGAALRSTLEKMRDEEIVDEIALGELESGDVASLVNALYRQNEFPPAFVEQLARQCEGNPFFVTEMLRQMLAEGSIAKQEDKYVLVSEDYHIPDTVEDVVHRRLETLDPDAMALAEYASCIGREFERSVAFSLGTLRDAPAALDKLEVAGVVMANDGTAEFCHAIFQDVIYESIGGRWRSAYHKSLGEHYEEAYKDRIDEVLYELAKHFSRSNERQKAFDYCLRAGEKAENAFAPEQAITYYKDALPFLPKARLTDAGDKEIWILERLGNAHSLIGEYEAAIEHYTSALNNEKEKRKRADFHMKIAKVYEKMGEFEKGMEESDKGLELLRDEKCIETAKLLSAKGGAYMRTGSYDKASALLAKSLEIATKFNDKKEIAQAHHSTGSIYLTTGNYEEALKHLEKALKITFMVGIFSESAKIMAGEGMPPPCEHHVNES